MEIKYDLLESMHIAIFRYHAPSLRRNKIICCNNAVKTLINLNAHFTISR